MVQDVQVHGGTQVVDVGHKDVLLTLSNQLVQQTRVVEAGVDVPMAGGVPAISALPIHAKALGYRKERLFVYARVPGERTDSDSNTSILQHS